MIGYTASDTNKYFNVQTEYDLYIPLNFWFCRDKGLSLPIIALQNQEVRINVAFRRVQELIIRKNCTLSIINESNCKKILNKTNENIPYQYILNIGGLSLVEANLYVDYIYLADNERRYFAQSQHEYLIEQVQLNTFTLYSRGKTSNLKRCDIDVNGKLGDQTQSDVNCGRIVQDHRIELNFRHPIKELIWTFNSENLIEINKENDYEGNEWFNFGINTYPNCSSGNGGPTDVSYNKNDYISNDILNELECNNTDFEKGNTITAINGVSAADISPLLSAVLFIEGKERFQEKEYQYFKLIQPYQRHTNVPLDWIYLYSFAFEPEKITPTGTCNFSRIDNSHFLFKISKYLINPRLNIFATNYNLFVIKDGYGAAMYK